MNEPADNREAAGRWLRFAKEDLESAKGLDDLRMAPRNVCWAAQQSAEKAVKAALTFAGIHFPKTHDIDRLLSLVPPGWHLAAGVADTGWLSEWAPESRYPGDWPEGDRDDAVRSLAEATKVFETAVADLFDRGVVLEG